MLIIGLLDRVVPPRDIEAMAKIVQKRGGRVLKSPEFAHPLMDINPAIHRPALPGGGGFSDTMNLLWAVLFCLLWLCSACAGPVHPPVPVQGGRPPLLLTPLAYVLLTKLRSRFMWLTMAGTPV